MNLHVERRLGLFIALCLTFAAAVVALAITFSALPQTTPSPNPASPTAPGGVATSVGAAGATMGAAASPTSAPARTPIPPPLPALVGAIGDSITQAFDVAPGRFGDNVADSWVVGDNPTDGVFSIVERLRTLGAAPIVVDAAVAGRRMDDGVRQAGVVLSAAAGLTRGETALVTIELGGNDVCRASAAAMTAPAAFERQLRSTIATLRDGGVVGGKRLAGLPRGSRLLVLSIPDVSRLRRLTANVPEAQRVYALGFCRAFLGASVTDAQLAAGRARIVALNTILKRVCDEVETKDGATGRLHCRGDQDAAGAGSMYSASFSLADVSTLDYFHPSLSGQQRIADGAWAAGYWADAPLPQPVSSVTATASPATSPPG